jgi:aminotransferase in exopolysaccharide biosynthesis
MTFIPLSVPVLRGNELAYVTDCIQTGWVSSVGSYVTRFEQQIAQVTGARNAVACINGTAALHISLLLADVQPGDMVLVPTVTFIAPVNTVRYVQGVPVFMDCDEALNMDPIKVRAFCEDECRRQDGGRLVHRQTGARVAALIVVHVFGHPADLAALAAIADDYGLALIEDATEALGSRYTEGRFAGRQAGTVGVFGCYSFNGNKIVTTGGGGMIVTDREDLAQRARYLTTQAKDDDVRFLHNSVGFNYRLTNVQAALGVAQVEQLPKFLDTKRANFARYRAQLDGWRGLRLIPEPAGTFSNHWHYTLLVPPAGEGGKGRDALMRHLAEQEIQTRPIWELNHRQAPYRDDPAFRIDRAVWFHQRGLNLPCSTDLTASDVDRVCEAIKSLLGA